MSYSAPLECAKYTYLGWDVRNTIFNAVPPRDCLVVPRKHRCNLPNGGEVWQLIRYGRVEIGLAFGIRVYAQIKNFG